ncbi:helix-turn-helix domain-containing protein [Patescibacteria group bacterium]|nr:helix-turn-helix domain-containing protein [Patescibacteria group bacterium]
MEKTAPVIPIRVSVSEASRLFGVSTKTIRQAIKNNGLVYIVSRGRYKINFESLLSWSQNSTRRANQFKQQGLGQYVEKWRIRTKKFSPNQELVKQIVESKNKQQSPVKDSPPDT